MPNEFFAFLLIAAVVLGGIFGGANYMAQRECHIYGEITGKHTVYVWFASCYIEIDGRMEHWDAYKMRVATKSDD